MSPYETLPQMLAWRARVTPDATAFTFGDSSPTFAELWLDIERFATVIAGRGIDRGDHVMLALPNGPDFFAVFYGIQRAGAVAVPIFPDSSAERILDLVRISGARAVVLEESREKWLGSVQLLGAVASRKTSDSSASRSSTRRAAFSAAGSFPWIPPITTIVGPAAAAASRPTMRSNSHGASSSVVPSFAMRRPTVSIGP